MAKRTRKSNSTADPRSAGQRIEAPLGLRIVGGRFRGRRLQYGGDIRTRPMKDRLREAVFNLLGPNIRGMHAIDLFAGTGALAFEALSRGAARATLIEQHYPTAGVIRRNAAVLEVEEAIDLVTGNVFIWWKKKLGTTPADTPWVVFCSPPYDFYVQRTEEMLELIGGLNQAAPAGSAFVVEADERFDFSQLPDPQAWDVRPYPPAVVGLCWKS